MPRAKRQPNLPHVPEHSPEDPELRDRCEDLRQFRAERIELQRKEDDALKALLAYHNTLTNKPEVFRYYDEDGKLRVARFKITVKVSVRSEKSDDAYDGDTKSKSDGDGVDVE